MHTIDESSASDSIAQSLGSVSVEQAPNILTQSMGQREPIRILHVVGVMDRGGVETWLMHILRNIDRSRFSMDFLTQTSNAGQFDEEIRDLGSRLFPCLYPKRPWRYAAGLRHVLAGNRPYHVIHTHVHHYNGFVLRLANHAGIPVRIAHSHNDTSTIDAAATLSRRGYLQLSKRWISRFSSCKLAASRKAALSLFGPQQNNNPWRVLPYSADLAPFELPAERRTLRAELGIPNDVRIVGHVGRFVEQKNHEFLVRIAAQVLARNSDIHFVLVGDGPLRGHIEEQVARLNLTRHFSFLGVRSDVARLMSGAMDAFLFPSLHEGLGLVLVEAQAAGLPCLYSDCVPEEAAIVAPLVHRVSLDRSASDWGNLILNVLESQESLPNQRAALERVQRSVFNIHNSLGHLEAIYEGSPH